MRRAALLAVAGVLIAGAASAQLVPLARCQAAYPCNLPYALLPADAVANLPDARSGSTLISVGIDGALKPRVVAPPVSNDFADDAARLYVLKHPLPKPAATPASAAAAAPAPKPNPTP
jgi:hypothetical protein